MRVDHGNGPPQVIGQFTMRESTERVIKIGFSRSAKKIFDEIETVSAAMIRQGWQLYDTCLEDGLGCVHLFFERELDQSTGALQNGKPDSTEE